MGMKEKDFWEVELNCQSGNSWGYSKWLRMSGESEQEGQEETGRNRNTDDWKIKKTKTWTVTELQLQSVKRETVGLLHTQEGDMYSMFYQKLLVCLMLVFFRFQKEKTSGMKANWLIWQMYIWLTPNLHLTAVQSPFSSLSLGLSRIIPNKAREHECL